MWELAQAGTETFIFIYLRSLLQKRILSQRAFDRDAVLGIRMDEGRTHPGTKPMSISGSHSVGGGDKGEKQHSAIIVLFHVVYLYIKTPWQPPCKIIQSHSFCIHALSERSQGAICKHTWESVLIQTYMCMRFVAKFKSISLKITENWLQFLYL